MPLVAYLALWPMALLGYFLYRIWRYGNIQRDWELKVKDIFTESKHEPLIELNLNNPSRDDSGAKAPTSLPPPS